MSKSMIAFRTGALAGLIVFVLGVCFLVVSQSLAAPNSGGGGVVGDGSAHTIRDVGTATNLPAQALLSFDGAGIDCEDGTGQTICTVGSSGHAIRNAGSGLVATPILNFTGAGITCSNGSGETTCNVPTSSGGVASARVLEINNPPTGSGLTIPSGAGVSVIPDPQLVGRVDDAAAINAAIQYACDNNYDIAYLGEGHYRVGAVGSGSFPFTAPATGIIFYSGVRIVADTCPNGIKFYGAGVGKTVLLANSSSGQNLITVTDFNALTSTLSSNIRVGVNSHTNNNGSQVNSFSNASPPVFTTNTGTGVAAAFADSHLQTGDRVHIRNCAGMVEVNDREFEVFACNGNVATGTAVTQCSLRGGDGKPVDSTPWGAWVGTQSDSKCIITKLYDDFDTEIAYMTLHDDAMFQHSGVDCVDDSVNPGGQAPGVCGWGAGEETHGIGSYVGGSRMNIHHISIENMGDEGVDVSAPEADHWLHDMQILDAQHGGVVISQGASTLLERMKIWKTYSFVNTSSTLGQAVATFGAASEPPYTTGNCWNIGAAGKNGRALNTTVRDINCGGEYGAAWDISTGLAGNGSTGDLNPLGQYIEGVSIIGGIYNIRPEARHCAVNNCSAFRIKAFFGYHPITNVTISGGVYSGWLDIDYEVGGPVTFDNNKLRPIPGNIPRWAIVAQGPHLTISNNDVAGHANGAVGWTGYRTGSGSTATITTRIVGNLFADMGGAAGLPYLGRVNASSAAADTDEAYLDIIGNRLLVGQANTAFNVIKLSQNGAPSFKNVLIADNYIHVHPDIATASINSGAIRTANHNTTIRNNTVVGPVNAVFAILADNVTVEGNKLSVGPTPTAGLKTNMRAVSLQQGSNFRMIGNDLRDYSSGSTRGLNIYADNTQRSDYTIEGNIFRNVRNPIHIGSVSETQLTDFRIANNHIDMSGLGTSVGIQIESAQDGLVQGNTIVGSSGGSGFAYRAVGSTDRFDVSNNFIGGTGVIAYGSNAGLGDATCSATGNGAASECRNNFGTAESAALACREHWVQWVESGSNTHSVLAGFGGMLEHAEADFVKTSSSSDYASCWSWNFDPTKTGIVYNPAAGTCPKSGASNIRFAYKVGGGVSVARSILTTVTALGTGLSNGTDMTLGGKIPGTSDQSLAGAVNQASKFNGIGNENAWEGQVVQASRLGLVAQGTTGAFTLTTGASTYLRVHTVDCGAP
jgi:hypothetical protein